MITLFKNNLRIFTAIITVLVIIAAGIVFFAINKQTDKPTSKAPPTTPNNPPQVEEEIITEFKSGVNEPDEPPPAGGASSNRSNAGEILETPNVNITIPRGFSGKRGREENSLILSSAQNTRVFVSVTKAEGQTLEQITNRFIQPDLGSNEITLSVQDFKIANRPANLLIYQMSRTQTSRIIAVSVINNKVTYIVGEGSLADERKLISEVKLMASSLTVK